MLDGVVRGHADPFAMDEWVSGPRGQAMVRAAIFRVLGDRPADLPVYAAALDPLLARDLR